MALKGFTEEQLSALEQSLLGGISKGVRFSLADVRSEIRRRQRHRFDPREVVATILEQVRASKDGLTTYGELWSALTGGTAWQGNSSQSTMGRELGQALAYCHQNGLPMVPVLVVRQSDRSLSAEAVERICEDCTKLGLEIGSDKSGFVESQATAARQLSRGDLPMS